MAREDMEITDQEICVLNHFQGETVCYPLVLLEGIICPNSETSGPKRIRRLSNTRSDASSNPESEMDNKIQALDSKWIGKELEVAQDDLSILIKCGDHEMSWPVVSKGFKVVVPLNTGENLIVLKVPHRTEMNELKLKLTYTPVTISRFVRVVYIKCADSDGSFDAPANVPCGVDSAIKRLAFNSRLLQTFTAESLYQHGLGRQTFCIEEDDTGSPKVHIFTSKLKTCEALGMTGDQLYAFFNKELKSSSLFDPMCKFWTFMSCTHYEPPSPDLFDEKHVTKYIKAHTALGGSHLALFGTGGLHTWAPSIKELVPCFTDGQMIDKLQLFDDSGGRGTYWANYATGLGASIHELGHCFDLAHTPKGIMGRGFDDMNCVFTMWKQPTSPGKDTLTTEKSVVDTAKEKSADQAIATAEVLATGIPGAEGLVPKSMSCTTSSSSGNTDLATPNEWSHGAHWYRSSAVLLRYHKWFSTSNVRDNDIPSKKPIVHWSSTLCGPVGNCGGCHQKNQLSFNSVKWLESQGAVLGGFIIHAEEYVNCIQVLGSQEKAESGECQEVLSEPHGTDGMGKRYIFTINSPEEYIMAVDVRAGGWIDAIRFHTNYKSSVWMGGVGGDECCLRPSPGRNILGLMGTSGMYVGSLGVLLSSDLDKEITPTDELDQLVIEAPLGIRLIELWDKKYSEVYQHWEFLQPHPPNTFTLSRSDAKDQASTLLVEDDQGNIFRTAFVYNYNDFI